MANVVTRRLFSFLFHGICMIGFLFQVERISDVYFQYKTSSTVQHVMQSMLPKPTISLCIRYTDILDWDRLYRDGHISHKIRRSNRFLDMVMMHDNVTIRQILEYTPDPRELLSAVLYRSPNSYRGHYTKEPNDYLNITKYYKGETVCYRIQTLFDQRDLSFKRIAHSLEAPNVMLRLWLSRSMSKTDVFRIILHSKDMSTTSFYFSQVLSHLTDFQSNSPLATTFYYTYATNHIDLLESPYDTRCIKSKIQKSTCLHDCLMGSLIKATNRAPFQTYIDEPIDYKHINHRDIMNETMRRTVNQIDQECARKCFMIACAFDFTCTRLDHVSIDADPSAFSIIITVPRHPGVRIRTIVNLTFISFLVYICSCISSWFGLSVIALNPFRLMMKKMLRERMRQTAVQRS